MKFLKIFILTLLLPKTILCQQNFGYTTTQVNFRNGPGKEFQIICVLPENKKLEVLSITPNNDYIHVKENETERLGYIHKSYLTIPLTTPNIKRENSTSNINKTIVEPEEIIHWINDFENRNSPERIMEGTMQDKVNLKYENGILIINSMLFRMMSPTPLMIREYIILKDVIRIEALKTTKDDYAFVDFAIYTKEGSINMQCKEISDSYYLECPWKDRYYTEMGYISKNLRFKFPNNLADKEIDRVYNALTELFKSQGLYPKIGSLF